MLLALGTLLGFGGLGLVIIPYVREVDINSFFTGIKPIWFQFTAGVLFGIITAKAGWQIVELPIMIKTKSFFAGLIWTP